MESHTDLFASLDRDWAALAGSPEGEAALLRWTLAEPVLAGLVTLDELLDALRGRTGPGRRDRRMLAMLRIGTHDPAARRVVLQVVRPALSNIAWLYSRRWGGPDASSTVIVVALERIASFPTDRRHTNIAGHIVRDIRHVLFQDLDRELAFQETVGTPRNLAEAEDLLVAPPDRTPADRVAGLVCDALRAGRITRRHAQLILLSRLDGVPIQEIATAWRRPPQTVRRMRQRVERVLAEVAVA